MSANFDRELKDETIGRLQSEYYRLGQLIVDAQRGQREICEELLFRVEDSEREKRLSSPMSTPIHEARNG